ncbi:ATPase, V0 complex, subunit E1/e2 [Spinellus fusiger]|nr:ATPase, V0 complex, subunit E1/e2 [Spinellus fusiger]
MSGYTLLWAFIAVFLVCGAAHVLTPKGNNQTLIRTLIIMSLICCYLMWSVTYLAQLHPLINPKRVGLRPHHT